MEHPYMGCRVTYNAGGSKLLAVDKKNGTRVRGKFTEFYRQGKKVLSVPTENIKHIEYGSE